MRGSEKPEPLIELTIGDIMLYRSELKIVSLSTDANGYPTSYHFTIKDKTSLPVSLDFAKRSKLKIRIIDKDIRYDDVIYEAKIGYPEFKHYQIKDDQISHLDIEFERKGIWGAR